MSCIALAELCGKEGKTIWKKNYAWGRRKKSMSRKGKEYNRRAR